MNYYISSPDYVKPYHVYPMNADISYLQIMLMEMAKDTSQQKYNITVSERWDFLKAIELFNRKNGRIDKLVVCAEMWSYGIKMLSAGDPFDHWVTFLSFLNYDHEWDIGTIRLIGVDPAFKLNEKPTIAEDLLKIAERVEFFNAHKFSFEFEGNNITGINNKFDFIER
jgi:hypothetical protein